MEPTTVRKRGRPPGAKARKRNSGPRTSMPKKRQSKSSLQPVAKQDTIHSALATSPQGRPRGRPKGVKGRKRNGNRCVSMPAKGYSNKQTGMSSPLQHVGPSTPFTCSTPHSTRPVLCGEGLSPAEQYRGCSKSPTLAEISITSIEPTASMMLLHNNIKSNISITDTSFGSSSLQENDILAQPLVSDVYTSDEDSLYDITLHTNVHTTEHCTLQDLDVLQCDLHSLALDSDILCCFGVTPELTSPNSAIKLCDCVLGYSSRPLNKPDPDSEGELVDMDGLTAHQFFEVTDRIIEYDPQTGENITNTQYNQLIIELKDKRDVLDKYKFVLLPSEEIRLVQFYSDSAESGVKFSVTVTQHGQVHVQVHGHTLPRDHYIFTHFLQPFKTATRIIKFLIVLHYHTVCVGNYDQDMVDIFLSKCDKGSTENTSAYKESNIGTYGPDQRYSSTIRTKTCGLLVPRRNVRCEACDKYRGTLRKYKSRATKSTVKDRSDPLSSTKPNTSLSNVELQNKIRSLKRDSRKLKRRISRLEHKIQDLIQMQGENLTTSDSSDILALMDEFTEEFRKEFPDEKSYQRVFWESQRKYNSLKSKSSMKWHPAIIKWCIYMRSKSAKAYDVIRRSGFIALPSERCLYDYTHVLPRASGEQPEVAEHIIQEAEAKGMYSKGKDFIALLQDEMKIKEELIYDKATGELVGFVDIETFKDFKEPQDMKTSKSFKPINRPLARSVLVLMARGLTSDMRYPIAAYATRGVTAAQLYPVIWKAVRMLEIDCDLKVMCITCDGASPNRKFFKLHQRDGEDGPVYWVMNPYSEEERKVYFVSDVPHLIKTARNCFANSYSHRNSRMLWNNGQDISWGHIVSLYKLHVEPHVLVYAHKLTQDHINLTAYSQMKVSLAAQIFSRSVANALEHHFDQRYAETVKFIRIMNRFFDCLNTQNLRDKYKNRDLAEYRDILDERFRFLTEDFLGYFDDWERQVEQRPGEFTKSERSGMKLSHQTLDGFKITVNSIVECTKYMLEHGAKFVCTHKFNQDPLEEHFSHQRHKGGGHDHPTALDVQNNLRVMRVIHSEAVAPLRGNTRAKGHQRWLSNHRLPRRKVKRLRH